MWILGRILALQICDRKNQDILAKWWRNCSVSFLLKDTATFFVTKWKIRKTIVDIKSGSFISLISMF